MVMVHGLCGAGQGAVMTWATEQKEGVVSGDTQQGTKKRSECEVSYSA